MNKKLFSLTIALGFSLFSCKAQDSLDIVNNFRKIVKYIREDSISELAGIVRYPLIRPNPISDISNSKEFIAYASVMFDSVFRQKLSGYADSDIFYHNGLYGLVGGHFSGDIWMDDNGFVETINYHSAAERRLQSKMTREIQDQMNPAVNRWKENILVCETKKFLIRIDYLDSKEFRYVSWSKPKTVKDKPDLILLKGVEEFQGNMGDVTYTFNNEATYYRIDRVYMAESDDEVGLFLRIFKSNKDLPYGKPLISYKCHEIK